MLKPAATVAWWHNLHVGHYLASAVQSILDEREADGPWTRQQVEDHLDERAVRNRQLWAKWVERMQADFDLAHGL